ncbi:MAG TPA: tRNA-dependent cyclodipeptide synthase [Actinomycetota bacterium]|nr:tRNA-dependent cyclodipeptide synthase [Actinomycetota bacterium]
MSQFALCPVTGLEFRIIHKSNWARLPPEDVCASFEISISNSRCSSRFLTCQMNWASDRFEEFEFSIADTLRAYNYVALGHPIHGRLTLNAAQQVTKDEGRRWVEQNLPAIHAVLGNKPFRLMNWETWRSEPRFDSNFALLRSVYETDTSFRSCVDADVSAYAARQRHGHKTLDDQEMEKLALYLLEELAVYQIQAETRPTVNIYPGGMMQVFRRMGSFTEIPESLKGRHFAYFEIREVRTT